MNDPLLAGGVGFIAALLLLAVLYVPLCRDVDDLRAGIAELRGDPDPADDWQQPQRPLWHRLLHRGRHHRTDPPEPA